MRDWAHLMRLAQYPLNVLERAAEYRLGSGWGHSIFTGSDLGSCRSASWSTAWGVLWVGGRIIKPWITAHGALAGAIGTRRARANFCSGCCPSWVAPYMIGAARLGGRAWAEEGCRSQT